MRTIITQFAFALLVAIGCRQPEVDPTPIVTGTFNDSAWQQAGWSFKGRVWKTEGISSRPCQLNTINVTIEHHNSEGFLRQNLFIGKIPPRVGTYPVRDIYGCAENEDVGASFSLWAADGDALVASFRAVELPSNKLIIERIDSTTKQLSGQLQLTLAALRRSSTTPYDTVRITDCRFTLPITGK